MSRTEDIINRALAKKQGVLGEMITVSILRRGLTQEKVRVWQQKLREAADILDELIK